MNVLVRIQPWNHHPNWNLEHFHITPKFSGATFPRKKVDYYSDLYHHRLILPFLNFIKKKSHLPLYLASFIQYDIHEISSLLWHVLIVHSNNGFIHPDKQLSCLQFGAITNKNISNTLITIFWKKQICAFLLGLYNRHMYCFHKY